MLIEAKLLMSALWFSIIAALIPRLATAPPVPTKAGMVAVLASGQTDETRVQANPTLPSTPKDRRPTNETVTPSPGKPIPTREELENQFRETLTGAVLEGTWQVTGKGGLNAHEPLSESHTERYTIASVQKISDDQWLVGARIQFAEVDVTVPVPVRVLWAGDTPVIILDDLNIPMIGPYSARVMFHHRFYSGVWYSNQRNYGGVMSGRILTEEEARQKTEPSTETKPTSDSPEKPE